MKNPTKIEKIEQPKPIEMPEEKPTKAEQIKKAKKEIGLNNKLGFGKYSEMKVKEVIDVDPQYIQWASEKAGKKFTQEVYNALKTLNNNVKEVMTNPQIMTIPARYNPLFGKVTKVVYLPPDGYCNTAGNLVLGSSIN